MEAETPIEIRKQRNLGLSGTMRLCIKGVTHRMLRSVMTLSVVTLAVAFFMFLLSENALVTAAARVVKDRLAEQRLAARLLARLFESPSSLVLAGQLGRSVRQPAVRNEFAAVTGLKPAWVAELAAQAAREQAYFHFFDSMPPGKRLVLVQKREGREVFRCLLDAGEWAAFTEKLGMMRDQQLPGGLAEFEAFLKGFEAYMADLTTLENRWKRAIAELGAETKRRIGGVDFDQWLAGATSDELAAWAAFTRERGFAATPVEWKQAQAQVATARVRRAIVDRLNLPEARAEWRRLFKDRKPVTTEQKLLKLGDERAGRLLDGTATLEQRLAVAENSARETRLSALEAKLGARIAIDDADSGVLRPRQAFLLLISFLVCAVGVSNAMLMSITERFREIATMKCLGATDGYILTQFMLEAALQGSAGGLLGTLIGFTAALIKQGVALGGVVVAAWPGEALGVSAVAAMGAGILLAVLASVYPSWAASRMAPMEAMRVE